MTIRPNPLLSTARASQAELDLLLKMTPLEGTISHPLLSLTGTVFAVLRICDLVYLGIQTREHLHSNLRHSPCVTGLSLLSPLSPVLSSPLSLPSPNPPSLLSFILPGHPCVHKSQLSTGSSSRGRHW
jgi:hypothetical protein